MKRISVLLLMLLTISSSNVLHAQEGPRRLMGLGVSIDPARIGHANYFFGYEFGIQTAMFYNVSPILFYVPIDVTSSFRLEPSFGFLTTHRDMTTSAIPQSSNYPQTSVEEVSITTAGIRGSYISSLSNSLSLYVGPRLDLSFVSSTSEYSYVSAYPNPGTIYTGSTTMTETDVALGAVVGGEYFPASQFSVGGEISLNYLSFGNPTVTKEESPPPTPPITVYSTERKLHSFRTDALFFVRWYFLQVAPQPL